MTAQEKFEARLKELGLDGEYGRDDHVGCFLEDGSIVVLVHIQSDPTDGYSEFHYPPFEELWNDDRFREACKQEFYDSDDDHFVAELAYWLDIHKNGAKCPLFPVDAYWVCEGSEWFNYEDDEDLFQSTIKFLSNFIKKGENGETRELLNVEQACKLSGIGEPIYATLVKCNGLRGVIVHYGLDGDWTRAVTLTEDAFENSKRGDEDYSVEEALEWFFRT